MRGLNTIRFIVIVLVAALPLNHVLGDDIDPCYYYDPSNPCSGPGGNILTCSSARLDPCMFPRGFVFGTASAAYQYEGAYNVDGKGQSIWDTYMHEHPDRILDHSNGDVAADQYHRYKEDIVLMQEMGMDAYRFSISWPRILPSGKISGVVNQKELTHYNNVINEIIKHDMKPFVTIFHWDVPQHLEFEYGGFRDGRIVQDFQDYAELLFHTFGDRVKHWITLNEPSIFSVHGYDQGSTAPGQCSVGKCNYGNSSSEPYDVAHNLLLAHAAAVDVYRKKFKAQQKGKIGITLESLWMVPYTSRPEDIQARQRSLDFKLGWFMGPIIYGDYPKIMRDIVQERLPRFKPEDQKKIKGSMDFLGLNYYTANYAAKAIDHMIAPSQRSYSSDSMVVQFSKKNGIPIGEPTGAVWLFVYPQGLRDLLVYITHKYRSPVIYITENGMADKSNSTIIAEAHKDTQRKEYYCSHLYYLLKAINEDGVNVQGYFAWTFLDVLEWSSGFTNRFGLVYVDYKTNLQRYMKESALWFKEFLKIHACPRKLPFAIDSKEL